MGAQRLRPVRRLEGRRALPRWPRSRAALMLHVHVSQAADALVKGKETYATGERMAALKLFEAALDTMARRRALHTALLAN